MEIMEIIPTKLYHITYISEYYSQYWEKFISKYDKISKERWNTSFVLNIQHDSLHNDYIDPKDYDGGFWVPLSEDETDKWILEKRKIKLNNL
jgi:hypothetical protein